MTNKKSSSSSNGTHTVNKSAVTGRFVSNKQIQNNPQTTFKQTVSNNSNSSKKGK